MQKIKILYTIRQGSFGGGETYLFNLVMGLDKKVFEPRILSFGDGEMVDKFRENGITTDVVSTKFPFDLRVFRKVLKIIKEFQPNLIHSHGTRALSNTIFAARFSSIPHIYTVHGWSFHTGNSAIVTTLRRKTEQILGNLSENIICGSQSDVDTGKSLIKKSDFFLVHNSIDTKKYDPDKAYKNIRDEFGFTDNDIIVASIARITFQKDPLTFIKSAKLLVKRHSKIKFLLVGNGELKNKILNEINDSGLNEYIKHSDFRSDIGNILHSIDIFVLPSLWEVVPLGLLEAMSMQKACIATNIEGTTEALENNINGLTFSPGNYTELADKISEIITNKNLSSYLGKNARETVKTKFDLKSLIDSNKKIYLNILNK